MGVAIDIQIVSDVPGIPAATEICAWLQDAVCRSLGDDDAEMSLRIVDEAEGRALNQRFRQQDKPTNVLSFPAGDSLVPEGVPRQLGDIVICGPLVEREAREQGKETGSHWAHLLVHGALHLLGYDHETSADAAEMETIEKEILASRGIGDPYAVSN